VLFGVVGNVVPVSHGLQRGRVKGERGGKRTAADEGMTSAYRAILISVGLRTQKSLFTCHGINKKILSCFFEKRSIVLQSAVRPMATEIEPKVMIAFEEAG
jgi:hypothetical protein